MPSLYDRLPPETEVTDESLGHFTEESHFTEVAASLVDEAAHIAIVAAEIRRAGQPVLRDQGIAIGILLHSAHLSMALVQQFRDGHDGGQQLVINRQLIELHANLTYLCESGTPHEDRFEAYVNDSLIADRALDLDIMTQMKGRDGHPLRIEERMQRSIATTTNAAAVESLQAVPGRKRNNWPTAEDRITRLGPTAYSGYRMSSTVLHSAFSHIVKNYWVNADPEDVIIDYHPVDFRPQAFEGAAFHQNRITSIYATTYLPGLLKIFDQRCVGLEQRIRHVGTGHERFLAGRAQ